MHRILILRHDATDLALLRAALASCEAELTAEAFPSLGAGLVRLAEAREAGEPFAAVIVAVEGPSAPLEALWDAEPDLQVVLSLPTSESPEDLPKGQPERAPVLLRRPLDPLGTRQLILALLEKRSLARRAREQAERAEVLRATNERLEEATRAKSEFLANMSHEIRTPMSSILGYADLLRESGLPRSDFHTYLGVIRRNGDHLLRLVNDILNLSKIEAGRMEVEPEECSFEDLLEEVSAAVAPSARLKGLEFEVRYEGPLPATIRTDTLRARQILLNLASNAVKFTTAGSITLAARATQDDQLAIDVRDTGIGLDAEAQRRIFGAFTQAETSTTRRFGGTGLGLAIARRFARILGGDLSVQSEPGQGSVFTFTLDPGCLTGIERLGARPAPAKRAERATVSDSTPEERQDLGARVLVCEDGRDNQLLLRFYLRKAGCEVEIASDGAQALANLRAGLNGSVHYDLVLMDMQMPEADGYEVTRTARAEGWDGPIVALTAHAMPGDRKKCLDAGCDEYVTKPVDRAHLIATCARLLEAPRSALPKREEPAALRPAE